MPSELGLNFSRVPTFANFQRLAEQSPAEAKGALQRMQQGLAKAGAPAAELQQLDQILKAAETQLSALTKNSALLKAIFPDVAGAAPTNFGECIQQMTNVQSLQWSAGAAAPAIAISGTVSKNPAGEYILKTAGGRELTLTDSQRQANITPGMYNCWIEGFINEGEGQLTVQGVISTDGKSLGVEGYAPGTNPDFVFGRVHVKSPMGEVQEKLNANQLDEVMTQGRVYVQTARGDVEITDPALKKMLAQVPRLGIILPGAATTDANGQQVYAKNTDFLYALGGRFKGRTDNGAGVHETQAEFAYSVFKGPVRCEGETAKYRIEHSDNKRNWVGGTFVFDGADPHFAAKYISNDLAVDSMVGTHSGEAGTGAQLLAAAEVVDTPEDFVRKMGPPGGMTM